MDYDRTHQSYLESKYKAQKQNGTFLSFHPLSVVFVIVYCKEWPIGPIRNLEIMHWHTWVWDEYVLLPGLINLISPGCAAPHNYCTAAGPPGQMQMYSLYFAQLAELEQDNPGDAS